ncbi:MAG: hypothetical protein H7257_07625, partial [Taibaiella sp.]|nr:hypothetical protein [Taibaiella sp.]
NKIKGKNASGITYEFPANYIESFLSTLKTSLFASSNNEIIEFLNYTTYPNIREGLKEFKSFLVSGHTKVADYILHEQFRAENKSSYQVIPIHEFVKSIAVENRHYYNAEISRIMNLFTTLLDSSDHFISLYLLYDLNDLIENKQNFSRYVSSTVIIEKLTNLGYKINTVYDAISKLIKNELIDSDVVFTDVIWKELKLPSEFNIGITLKGHYYFKKMLYRFHYYDIVVQDTPIFNDDYFARMKAIFPESSETGKRNVQQKITLVRQFLLYLRSMENKQSNQAKAVYGLFTETISESIENEIKKMPIQASLKVSL